jgi:shikimate kinase
LVREKRLRIDFIPQFIAHPGGNFAQFEPIHAIVISMKQKKPEAHERKSKQPEAKTRNVILCGFMATGKSSVGRRLAEVLGYDFLDMDAAIEAEESISIPQIFSSRGEPAFRELESRMVDRIAKQNRHVIATGGGTVVNPVNLEKLKRCGILINLTADVQTILSRAGSGDDRPMLRAADREERIRSLMERRAHAYAQADFSIDTSSLTVDEVVQLIADRMNQ